jgi:hypothetical protein
MYGNPSNVKTTNLDVDELAMQGVRLENYYPVQLAW